MGLPKSVRAILRSMYFALGILRAKVNLMFTATVLYRKTFVLLDAAAESVHLELVRN